ncbi:6-phosphogluconolactonase [Leucobacter muris]|uniref:6-phosphogluconolactonase n=1 Tax=Leucobacter muris TaxID=1935379 RepID=A0ABX5QFR4_9MICO|nr:6-phosphogluconolactonase [Leucobacter muris]QAB17907.1 6-phosphogluconolactonase [Leucobacter muris]
MRVERVVDRRSLGESVATALIGVCRERQLAGAVPCVVLTGGRAGAQALLAVRDHRDRDTVDWGRVRFLWGDERWVPAGHADRNDLLADESLFAAVETDATLVHRVTASDSGLTLEEAAAEYADVAARVDRIDVVLSGVGEDGHIASLFPGRSELLQGDDEAAALPVRDSPKPPPERVTLTLPVLNRAVHSWLLAVGEGKAEALRAVLGRTEPLVPAARLAGRVDTVLWADDAALHLSA